MKTNDILNNIKFKKTYLDKSTLTSGNKYKITMTYNNKTISFIFNDNFENKSNLNDCLYCLILDSYSYEYNENDLRGFALEFGYEDFNEAKRVYNACKKQFERFNKLFTQEEREALKKHFENY